MFKSETFLSNTFPQGFRISKKFEHCNLGSGGKKTIKRSEQMKRKIRKNFFFAEAILYYYEGKSSNLRPLLSYATFESFLAVLGVV